MLERGRHLDLDRDMTPDEFYDSITKLGLQQIEAAKFLDLTPRMVRRYSAGDSPIPVPVVLLLRLLIRHKYFVPIRGGFFATP